MRAACTAHQGLHHNLLGICSAQEVIHNDLFMLILLVVLKEAAEGTTGQQGKELETMWS